MELAQNRVHWRAVVLAVPVEEPAGNYVGLCLYL